MFSPKADAALSVRVPSAADDRPSWMRVGVIAAIGFIAGVVWPRVAGVRLGPAVPESASASQASPPSAEGSAQASSERAPRVVETEPQGSSVPPAPAAVVASAMSSAPSAGTPASGPASTSISVGHGALFACKSSDGESLKGAACGAVPGLDALLIPRLRKLADCPEASAANGVLHLILHPDFARGTTGVELGRGQGVSSPEALLACARSDLAGVSLSGLTHDNARYSVSYRVTFGDVSAASPTPKVEGTPSAPTPRPSHTPEDPASEGTAQIVWEVALVRDAPKTGKIVARLQRGSSVRVGAVKDGWYPVKYGDGFAADGWIYRGALGR